jgi:multiple sugar transport system ATP-binding protein
MSQIKLEQVSKEFSSGLRVVDGVDLEIASGEFLVLVGPSGCGKSTLLRMIAGLEEVTAGEITIGERVVTHLSPRDRDIAMVFQNYALYPHLTVERNLAYGLRVRHTPKAEIAQRVREVAEMLGLEPYLQRKPSALSGGQRQRVAMGRAIVRNPKVFLMDEPLSNLDAKLRVQMRAEVARIQSRVETTTIYVTHDQTEAMTLGDRVAVMRAGVLQQVDSPKNLYERPDNLFVAGFIGSPSMNFFAAQVDGDTLKLPFADVPLDDAHRRALSESGVGRDDLVVGIRPEHFEDASLVGEQAAHGVTFEAPIDITESMGSEVYAYFNYEGGNVSHDELAELAADAGAADLPDTEGRAVARLDSETSVTPGQKARLWMDSSRIQLFHGQDGRAIRVGESGGASRAGRQGSETTRPAPPLAGETETEQPQA